MTNAKEEFSDHVLDVKSNILAARISKDDNYFGDSETFAALKIGYSKDDYDKFINKLDFKYDSGYGSQKLFGTIWYKDGTWSSRGEYDGSEWWEYNKVPEIPEELL